LSADKALFIYSFIKQLVRGIALNFRRKSYG